MRLRVWNITWRHCAIAVRSANASSNWLKQAWLRSATGRFRRPPKTCSRSPKCKPNPRSKNPLRMQRLLSISFRSARWIAPLAAVPKSMLRIWSHPRMCCMPSQCLPHPPRVHRRRRNPPHQWCRHSGQSALKPAAKTSTTKSAKCSSKNWTRRSSACGRCCGSGTRRRTTMIACDRCGVCSTPSRAAGGWLAHSHSASSAGRSRACSTAFSKEPVHPVQPFWHWSARPPMPCRSCTLR